MAASRPVAGLREERNGREKRRRTGVEKRKERGRQDVGEC